MFGEYRFNRVSVDRVVDGDTVRLKIDLGFHMECVQTFRIRDIDTPEIYRPRNEAELRHGQEAKQFVIDTLERATQISVVSYKTGLFGRWEGSVYVVLPEDALEDNPHCLAELLKQNGFEKLESYE